MLPVIPGLTGNDRQLPSLKNNVYARLHYSYKKIKKEFFKTIFDGSQKSRLGG